MAFLADGVGSVEYRENVDARTMRIFWYLKDPPPNHQRWVPDILQVFAVTLGRNR